MFSTNTQIDNNKIKINGLFLLSSLGILGVTYQIINDKKQPEKINWLKLKEMLESSNISKIELINNKQAKIYEDDKIYYMAISNR